MTFLLGASVLFLSVPVQASTYSFTLTGTAAGNYSYKTGYHHYNTIPAGLYTADLTYNNATTSLLVFCLDGDKTSYYGQAYNGTVSTPQLSDTSEAEAAFLADYALTNTTPADRSQQSTIKSVEGPVTMAIWQIMGTLGTGYHAIPKDPSSATTALIADAQDTYNNHQITQTFLNQFLVFTPADCNSQRFIAMVPTPTNTGAAPEPGTWAMIGGGLLLVVLGRRKHRAARMR